MAQSNDLCLACGVGHCRPVQRDLSVETEDGHTVVVPKVMFLRCEACDAEVVPAPSHKYVDNYIADQAEQLSPDDVRRLFDRVGETQQAFAEQFGLGAKTLTRWLSGVQHPNRALGFYLRSVAEFPQLREWIRERRWKLAVFPAPRGADAPVVSVSADRVASMPARRSPPSIPNYARNFRGTVLRVA